MTDHQDSETSSVEASRVSSLLPDEHPVNWPLGIYPPALKRDWLPEREGIALVLLALVDATVTLLQRLELPIPKNIDLAIAFLIIAVTIFAICKRLKYLRKASWCLRNSQPTKAHIRLLDQSKGADIVVSLQNKVDVSCLPLSTRSCKMLRQLKGQLVPVNLWCEPTVGLPVAIEHKGEIILLDARKPKISN